jgi:hypothetical protein
MAELRPFARRPVSRVAGLVVAAPPGFADDDDAAAFSLAL